MALCEMGDSAVPAVADLLKSSDFETRRRAARILWNMDSAASRKALTNHMAREEDPRIKQVFGVPRAK
jgi:HEAT repeat protein